MKYFYCVDSNQIMSVVLFSYHMRLLRYLLLTRQWWFFRCLFFQSGKLNVNNVCEHMNNSIKLLNGELNCSTVLWEKRQSKCFATCSPPILKTIFSYFKIYSPFFPCHYLADNLWVPHSYWKPQIASSFQRLAGHILK